MIYLIGGAPRCGKTFVAKKLAKELGISWISADTLEGVVAEYVPKTKVNKLFPKSLLRKKTLQSNDLMYTKYSTKQITQAYIEQSKAVWKAVEAICRAADFEEYDFIIEGHQIHPELIAKIKKDYINITSLVIIRKDIKSIVDGCLKNKAVNDWFITKTKNPEIFEKIAMMIREYSIYFEKQAKLNRIKVLYTDNNFEKSIKDIVNYLKNN